MNSGNISSHELDEWEDVCRFHSDSRSMMILRLITEVRHCWSELDVQENAGSTGHRADLKLVAKGAHELAEKN